MNNLDDVIKEFEEKAKNAVSSTRNDWEGSDLDNDYSVDIHVWRKPGMGNSLQTIIGNKISIMTAVTSLLTSLLSNKVFNEEELDSMVKYAQKTYKNKD